MKKIRRVKAMQSIANCWAKEGRCVSFVPTMGALHAGHLSLIGRARKLCGAQGIVVVSLFVNPTQFNDLRDFQKYPNPVKDDLRMCADAGVDYVFIPTVAEMYGENDSTQVTESRLSLPMEGASRPGHLSAVLTIVSKLFNLVRPDIAVFGEKDFQQATLIQQMVRDLNYPIRIVVAPTLREVDGLAMSSRNTHLHGSLRSQARSLWHCIKEARQIVRQSSGGIPTEGLRGLKHRLKLFLEQQKDARVDYIEFFDEVTLLPVRKAQRGDRIALAVFIGKTRLIDNARL